MLLCVCVTSGQLGSTARIEICDQHHAKKWNQPRKKGRELLNASGILVGIPTSRLMSCLLRPADWVSAVSRRQVGRVGCLAACERDSHVERWLGLFKQRGGVTPASRAAGERGTRYGGR